MDSDKNRRYRTMRLEPLEVRWLLAVFAPIDGAQLAADIAAAAADGDSANTIELGAGTYAMPPAAASPSVALVPSGPTQEKTLTIAGEPDANTIVSGDGTARVFSFVNQTVLLKNMTIEDGLATTGGPSGGAAGGGILIDGGYVTLSNCTVRSNRAVGTDGSNGAAGVAGVLGGNGADGGKGASASGGGIYLISGTLNIFNSTITRDAAQGGAGGAGGAGVRGTDGENGAPGVDGSTGVRGADGASGPVGGDGGAGESGQPGEAGQNGGDGGAGGRGGNGGTGGNAFGGGIAVQSGTLTLNGDTFSDNWAAAGAGGGGGRGGNGGPGGNGGAQGIGGHGGEGGTGGVGELLGPYGTWHGGPDGNGGVGGAGGDNGNGGDGGNGGAAGAGGNGGAGGNASGGGIALFGGIVNISEGTFFENGAGRGRGGIGGEGGVGGDGAGGGGEPFLGEYELPKNGGGDGGDYGFAGTRSALGGNGGSGGTGGVGGGGGRAGGEGRGGNGGNGGNAHGGGIAVFGGILGLSQASLSGNSAVAGNGGAAGDGNLAAASAGGGGDVMGGNGGLYGDSGPNEPPAVDGNGGIAGIAGAGGAASNGGAGGSGGNGGSAAGGAVAVSGGEAFFTSAAMTTNSAAGGKGGTGGRGGDGNPGGAGGLAHGGGGGVGASGGRGGFGGMGGNGGDGGPGGNGGAGVGGGIALLTGALALNNTALSENSADGGGGAGGGDPGFGGAGGDGGNAVGGPGRDVYHDTGTLGQGGSGGNGGDGGNGGGGGNGGDGGNGGTGGGATGGSIFVGGGLLTLGANTTFSGDVNAGAGGSGGDAGPAGSGGAGGSAPGGAGGTILNTRGTVLGYAPAGQAGQAGAGGQAGFAGQSGESGAGGATAGTGIFGSTVTVGSSEPVIGVTGNGQLISDGSPTPTAANGTSFPPTQIGSSPASQTYTITNSGSAPLLLGSVAITGTNAGDFKVTSPPAASVPIGGSTTFTIEFAPTAAAARTATVKFVENDPTAASPFNFALSGVATAPKIAVTGNNQSIGDDSTTTSTSNDTAFGSTLPGTSLSETYTITNSGTAPLTLGTVSIGGTNAANFTVTSPPATSVPIGGSTSFTVEFTPTVGGTSTATVGFTENGPAAKSPFTFAVSGMATSQITGSGQQIADGSTTTSSANQTAFGSTAVGGSLSETYTITNSGSDVLTLGNVSISGTNAGDFQVTAQPASAVPVGGSTSFTIQFTPGGTGTRTATVSFDEGDPTTFTFAISGMATGPSISVTPSHNSTNYTAGAAAVGVDAALTVTSTVADLTGATVTISPGTLQSGDVLSFSSPGGSNIGGSYAGGVLTLSGTATPAQYQAALESVAFSSASTNTTARSISIVAVDGGLDSNVAAEQVNVLAPVTIAGVYISGSAWTSTYKSYLAGHGLGSSTMGYAMLTGGTATTGQLAPLPWANLNTIDIQFSGPVTGITTGSLRLVGGTGTGSVAAPTITAVSYLGGNAYQISLSGSLGNNKYVLAVASTNSSFGPAVVDANGAGISGTFTTSSSSFPSGNGLAGSTFDYFFDVLPGNANQSGLVNAANTAAAKAELNFRTTTTGYNYLVDYNGAGLINANDVNVDSSHLNNRQSAITSPAAPGLTVPAPILTSNQMSVNATAGQTVTVDSAVTVSSFDTNVTGAVVTISGNFQSGDTLHFTPQNGISIVSNSGGALTLTGTTTPANYQTALQSITYSSTSTSTLARTVGFVVQDSNDTGNVASNTATTQINVSAPVTITGLYISGSAWTSTYKTYLSTHSLGSSTLGYALKTGGTATTGQLATLPWANLNTIDVQFSGPVTGITTGSLKLVGGTGTGAIAAPTITAVSSLGGNAYQVSLSGSLGNNKYVIAVASTGSSFGPAVTDANGAGISGTFTTSSSSFPSGNGLAGSTFDYFFDVLPGNGNQSGLVNAANTAAAKAELNFRTTTTGYNYLVDYNGAGVINANDVNIDNSHLNNRQSTITSPAAPSGALVGGLSAGFTALALGVQESGSTSLTTGGSTSSGSSTPAVANVIPASTSTTSSTSGSSTASSAGGGSGGAASGNTGTTTTGSRGHGSHSLAGSGELSRAATDEAVSDFDLVDLWA